MLRNPRISPVSGLSSQGLVLALAGIGAALFLFLLLPRMTASRAAAPRGQAEAAPVVAGTAISAETTSTGTTDLDGKPAPRPVELPNPFDTAPVPATASGSTAAALPALALSAAEAPDREAEGQELLGASAKPEVVGPKLTYAKREGKSEVLEPGAMRQRNKEKAKARLEKATEKALAEGKPPPENLRAKAATKGNGGKPTRPNAKGKKKPDPKPEDVTPEGAGSDG